MSDGRRYDVVGTGIATVDELLYVDAFPRPDGKMAARAWMRSIGGLSAIAVATAARLGGTAAFLGAVGTDDDLSRYVLEALAQEGVDTAFTPRVPGYTPIHAMIVVGIDPPTRNIFGFRPLDSSPPGLPPIPDEAIAAARVLFVDSAHGPRTIAAMRTAAAIGIPIVADVEMNTSPHFAELFALADHLIVPVALGRILAGADADPPAMLRALWSDRRRLAAITDGEAGCWFRVAPESVVWHHPAFPVVAQDTTGCGDVFHGAYALAIARGESVHAAIRFASAAGAVKASRAGGQAGLPRAEDIAALLENPPTARQV